MSKLKLNSRLATMTCLVLLCFCSSISNAANETYRPTNSFTTSAEKVDVAPVIVNGEVLFELRGFHSFPAKKRVKRIDPAHPGGHWL